MNKMILLFIPIFIVSTMWGCGLIDMTNPDADEFDVQIIGDSVFDLDGFIHDYLVNLSGKSYKDNASSGDTVKYITKQYRKTIEDNPYIRTIIMDGGANDLLTNMYWNVACRSNDEPSWSCKRFIRGITDDIEELWEEIDSDGIDDIVHMGYYNIKPGYFTLNGTRLNGAVNYAIDTAKERCLLSPTSCHFVDVREDFLGNEGSYIKSDGLHPTSAGGKVLAERIWETLVAENIYR